MTQKAERMQILLHFCFISAFFLHSSSFSSPLALSSLSYTAEVIKPSTLASLTIPTTTSGSPPWEVKNEEESRQKAETEEPSPLRRNRSNSPFPGVSRAPLVEPQNFPRCRDAKGVSAAFLFPKNPRCCLGIKTDPKDGVLEPTSNPRGDVDRGGASLFRRRHRMLRAGPWTEKDVHWREGEGEEGMEGLPGERGEDRVAAVALIRYSP